MEDNVKINFFKKIWYSIAKPSKYEDLRKNGLGKAIKYIFLIIILCALIIAIISSLIQQNIVKEAISYLDEKLPEIKFKDNTLSLENNEEVIINDNKIINYFGNVIVINPIVERQEAINQYKTLTTEKNNVIIFLNKEYILVSNKYNSENQEGIVCKKYEEVSSKYVKDENNEYSKRDIIEYLKKNASYTYYIAQYFAIYFIMITFLYFIYIILISLSIWLVTKISKIKWKYKESLINTIYASSLSIIIYVVYMIISFFTKFRISFIDVINILIIYVYLYILIYLQKKEKINN